MATPPGYPGATPQDPTAPLPGYPGAAAPDPGMATPPGYPSYPGMPSPDPDMVPPPGYGTIPPDPSMAPPPAVPPKKGNTPLIIGVVAGVLALCLLGICGVVVAAVTVFNDKDSQRNQAGGSSLPTPYETRYDPPNVERTTYSPPADVTTTKAPPPPPAKIGQCIVVSESGSFQGIGNCNGTRGTYRVVSVDYEQNTCADSESGYITEDGYRMCLELHLVRFYCYKFPKGRGWVVAASACKAKGTVHVIDIVPGASNGNRCTRNYKWNRWYRFTHPTVVYCVMQY